MGLCQVGSREKSCAGHGGDVKRLLAPRPPDIWVPLVTKGPTREVERIYLQLNMNYLQDQYGYIVNGNTLIWAFINIQRDLVLGGGKFVK